MFMWQGLNAKGANRTKKREIFIFCDIRHFRGICVKDFLTLE